MKPGSVLGVITARGGSKGLPGKNIRDLAGKPLIAWTIETALAASRLSRVVVSTDAPDIAAVARRYGAEVPFLRPAEFAQDHTPHSETLLHTIDWFREHGDVEFEYVMTLQPTSPFRSVEDIDSVVELALSKSANAVVSVCESRQHPLWAKRIRDDGVIEPYVSYDGDLRRQLLPRAFANNGSVYLTRCDRLRETGKVVPPGTHAYIMPGERSLDIDTPWDFYLADLLLREQHDYIKKAA